MFDKLPPELLERVVDNLFKYNEEIPNLACCSRSIYQVMKPYLWRRLDLCLLGNYCVNREIILKNKHYIKEIRLRFQVSKKLYNEDNEPENLYSFVTSLLDSGMKVTSLYVSVDGNISTNEFESLLAKVGQIQTFSLGAGLEGPKFNWDSVRFFPQNLKKLRFTECWSTTDQYLSSILSANPNLTFLSVYEYGRVTSRSLETIGRLTKLTHLEIHGYSGEEEDTLDLRFIAQLVNLLCLKLSCTRVKGDSLLSAWSCLSNLTELDIGYVDGITSIGDIQHLQNLRRLSITNYQDFDGSFARNVVTLKQLTYLSFESHIYDSHNGSELVDKLAGLNELQFLRKIEIKNYKHNTDIPYALCVRKKGKWSGGWWSNTWDSTPKWGITVSGIEPNWDTDCMLTRLK